MTRDLLRSAQRFFKNEEGVTAVECALMLALVVVIWLVALSPGSRRTQPAHVPIVVVSE